MQGVPTVQPPECQRSGRLLGRCSPGAGLPRQFIRFARPALKSTPFAVASFGGLGWVRFGRAAGARNHVIIQRIVESDREPPGLRRCLSVEGRRAMLRQTGVLPRLWHFGHSVRVFAGGRCWHRFRRGRAPAANMCGMPPERYDIGMTWRTSRFWHANRRFLIIRGAGVMSLIFLCGSWTEMVLLVHW